MRSLSRNLWWLCLAVLLLGAPYRLAAEQTSVSSDTASAQSAATAQQFPSNYTNLVDSDCAIRIQIALVNASEIQHRISSFEVDDPVTPQSQHRRNGIESAAISWGRPTTVFTRLYSSRASSESWRAFHHSGRAPPAV